jgi:hypothetical protein
MKKINLKIRVLDDGRIAFAIENNYDYSETELIGILELLKKVQLDKLGEIKIREVEE